MPRTVLVIAVLLALAVAAAAAWWALTRTPAESRSAPLTAERAMEPFREIVFQGSADVVLVQGEAEAIAVEVAGGSVVHAVVSNGVMTVDAGDGRRWWSSLLGASSRTTRITITFRELDGLRASGAVRIDAERLRAGDLELHFSGAAKVDLDDLQARTLSIHGSGAFKADVAGRVDTQRISISGAGDYRAADLVSDAASISVSGAGRATVHARKTLEVDLSGAAKVDYRGDPKVTQRLSGAARIRRLDSAESAAYAPIA
jgi:hypothetical protein